MNDIDKIILPNGTECNIGGGKSVIWQETNDNSKYWNQKPVMRENITIFETNDIKTENPTPFEYNDLSGSCTADFEGTSITFNFNISLEDMLRFRSVYAYSKICSNTENKEGSNVFYETTTTNGNDVLLSPNLNFTTDNSSINVDWAQAHIKIVSYPYDVEIDSLDVSLTYNDVQIQLSIQDLFNTDTKQFYSKNSNVDVADEDKYYVLATV